MIVKSGGRRWEWLCTKRGDEVGVVMHREGGGGGEGGKVGGSSGRRCADHRGGAVRGWKKVGRSAGERQVGRERGCRWTEYESNRKHGVYVRS